MPSKSSRKRRARKQKTNYTKIIAVVAVIAVIAVIVGYVLLNNNSTPEEAEEELTQMKVLLETSMGNITIQLRDDMPITTANFKKLVHDGTYDNTIFHRVIAGFMIQGGDPNGNGLSDDGLATITDEFTTTNENNRGTIAMAKLSDAYGNMIEDSGCSQFFINVVNNNGLDDGYSVFGEVTDGMDVVDAISHVDTNSNDKPLEDITLIRATLID